MPEEPRKRPADRTVAARHPNAHATFTRANPHPHLSGHPQRPAAHGGRLGSTDIGTPHAPPWERLALHRSIPRKGTPQRLRQQPPTAASSADLAPEGVPEIATHDLRADGPTGTERTLKIGTTSDQHEQTRRPPDSWARPPTASRDQLAKLLQDVMSHLPHPNGAPPPTEHADVGNSGQQHPIAPKSTDVPKRANHSFC